MSSQMRKNIRCPHFEQCLDDKIQLQMLVTEDGGYAEICPECVAKIADELVADMATADFQILLKRVQENA